jgi:hypothetical protein
MSARFTTSGAFNNGLANSFACWVFYVARFWIKGV